VDILVFRLPGTEKCRVFCRNSPGCTGLFTNVFNYELGVGKKFHQIIPAFHVLLSGINILMGRKNDYK